jgi:outer membrane protein TolC
MLSGNLPFNRYDRSHWASPFDETSLCSRHIRTLEPASKRTGFGTYIHSAIGMREIGSIMRNANFSKVTRVLAAIFACLWLSGCALNPFAGFYPKRKITQTAQFTRTLPNDVNTALKDTALKDTGVSQSVIQTAAVSSGNRIAAAEASRIGTGVEAVAEVPTAPPSELSAIAENNRPSTTQETLNQPGEAIPINLPSALAMIGGQHPAVGLAQWRVKEAYAQLDRAKVMWLPSIQSGFNYRRRDGNYQAVDGSIVNVDLNSMNYGLGAGAVAAGSPTRPGVVAQFHLADALFLPKSAEKTAWARGHAASATLNQQLLNSGIAYMDLLEAYQDAQIIAESVSRAALLSKITEEFAKAGEGLKSDADRAATELSLLKTRQLAAQERQLVAATRLARALSIPTSSSIIPQDVVAVPLELMPHTSDESSLIATGLATRPELKESQALVAAACEAYKREKYAPFVPSVLLGFSTTSFGGGVGNSAHNFDGRYDLDAMMVWETRNLGFGESAARRERNAQVQQASFAKLRILDQVAQEVAEAHIQVGIRKQQVEESQTAISRAQDSYQRNMDRIREGQGLPIEALQAIQALEASQRAYLRSVVDYNRSQLQLQWALGWPVSPELEQ